MSRLSRPSHEPREISRNRSSRRIGRGRPSLSPRHAAIIPAVEDVIAGSREFEPCLAGHGGTQHSALLPYDRRFDEIRVRDQSRWPWGSTVKA